MFYKKLFRQCPYGSIPYIIQSGDTLFALAVRFNTTVNAILALNPGIIPERLFIGQTLCIPQPTCPSGTEIYVIKGGDTIALLAKRFNTTVSAILDVNPGIVPERLFIGQEICIPRQIQEPSCPIGTAPYTIRSGDTLAKIAGRFNTSVEAILFANPGIIPERLSVGQIICVAQEKPLLPACPTSNYYVITKGDTLASIAFTFDVGLQELLNANPGINPRNLYIGQVVCIPAKPSPVGITVSIPAKTLTLYRQGSFVKAYTVATGKPNTPTPTGTFTIVNKQIDPGGPFGTRWMGLSEPHYGIHGTNNPASIGQSASNGCIRMYNCDVNELFNDVAVGTVVRIF